MGRCCAPQRRVALQTHAWGGGGGAAPGVGSCFACQSLNLLPCVRARACLRVPAAPAMPAPCHGWGVWRGRRASAGGPCARARGVCARVGGSQAPTVGTAFRCTWAWHSCGHRQVGRRRVTARDLLTSIYLCHRTRRMWRGGGRPVGGSDEGGRRTRMSGPQFTTTPAAAVSTQACGREFQHDTRDERCKKTGHHKTVRSLGPRSAGCGCPAGSGATLAASPAPLPGDRPPSRALQPPVTLDQCGLEGSTRSAAPACLRPGTRSADVRQVLSGPVLRRREEGLRRVHVSWAHTVLTSAGGAGGTQCAWTAIRCPAHCRAGFIAPKKSSRITRVPPQLAAARQAEYRARQEAAKQQEEQEQQLQLPADNSLPQQP